MGRWTDAITMEIAESYGISMEEAKEEFRRIFLSDRNEYVPQDSIVWDSDTPEKSFIDMCCLFYRPILSRIEDEASSRNIKMFLNELVVEPNFPYHRSYVAGVSTDPPVLLFMDRIHDLRFANGDLLHLL